MARSRIFSIDTQSTISDTDISPSSNRRKSTNSIKHFLKAVKYQLTGKKSKKDRMSTGRTLGQVGVTSNNSVSLNPSVHTNSTVGSSSRDGWPFSLRRKSFSFHTKDEKLNVKESPPENNETASQSFHTKQSTINDNQSPAVPSNTTDSSRSSRHRRVLSADDSLASIIIPPCFIEDRSPAIGLSPLSHSNSNSIPLYSTSQSSQLDSLTFDDYPIPTTLEASSSTNTNSLFSPPSPVEPTSPSWMPPPSSILSPMSDNEEITFGTWKEANKTSGETDLGNTSSSKGFPSPGKLSRIQRRSSLLIRQASRSMQSPGSPMKTNSFDPIGLMSTSSGKQIKRKGSSLQSRLLNPATSQNKKVVVQQKAYCFLSEYALPAIFFQILETLMFQNNINHYNSIRSYYRKLTPKEVGVKDGDFNSNSYQYIDDDMREISSMTVESTSALN